MCLYILDSVMIDQLEQHTEQLKMQLIDLGFALTPPTQIHSNKLRQINQHFQEMAVVLSQNCSNTLFDNICRVALAITTEYHTIHSLTDADRLCLETQNYVRHYQS